MTTEDDEAERGDYRRRSKDITDNKQCPLFEVTQHRANQEDFESSRCQHVQSALYTAVRSMHHDPGGGVGVGKGNPQKSLRVGWGGYGGGDGGGGGWGRGTAQSTRAMMSVN